MIVPILTLIFSVKAAAQEERDANLIKSEKLGWEYEIYKIREAWLGI